MAKRLSRQDWALIVEAIQMLEIDYEDEHPEQERLMRVKRIACERTAPPEDSEIGKLIKSRKAARTR